MTNTEQIAAAREFLATPNLGKDMARELNKALAYIRELADIAEASEARVKELEAERDASDRAFRALKNQSAACDVERLELRERIAELEAKLAAVPDAATERTRQAEAELRDMLRVDIPSLKAERDAAVAALERVRETLSLHNPNGRLVKEVLAALDGAPEPEWEYTWAGTDSEGDDWVMDDVFTTRDSAESYLGRPIGRWVSTDNGELVRRRKAGPWVPVESETPHCNQSATRVQPELNSSPVESEPMYSLKTRQWSGTCPCVRAEQVDPECEWHGSPEFRIGGEFHPSAPVLPSSGVDEEKLAEVIGRDENYTRDIAFGGWTLDPRLAAHAVAEWLKGQGR